MTGCAPMHPPLANAPQSCYAITTPPGWVCSFLMLMCSPVACFDYWIAKYLSHKKGLRTGRANPDTGEHGTVKIVGRERLKPVPTMCAERWVLERLKSILSTHAPMGGLCRCVCASGAAHKWHRHRSNVVIFLLLFLFRSTVGCHLPWRYISAYVLI